MSNISDYLPLFDVMIIYYFTIIRPRVFAIWFLFVLGLVCDSINGFPLGITALTYILTVKLFHALSHRVVLKENFGEVLGQFVFFAFVIFFLKWLMLSLYNLEIYNFVSPLIQLSTTCVAYILMHRFFSYLDKKLLPQS